MSSRFSHDFAAVRIHATPQAAATAAALHAEAYTLGNHVVMGAGAPSRTSLAGRLLMAHELAHVVQQSDGRSAHAPALHPDAAHERDARAAAFAAIAGTRPVNVTARTGVGIARAPGELRGIVAVARDLVIKELDTVPATLAEVEAGLRTISQGTGPSAEAAGRFLGRLEGDLRVPASHVHLREARQAAEDFLRRNMKGLPAGRIPRREVESILGLLEKGGGEAAGTARAHLDQIEQARQRVQELERARNPPQAFSSSKAKGRKSGGARKIDIGFDATKSFEAPTAGRPAPTSPTTASTPHPTATSTPTPAPTAPSPSTSTGTTTSGAGKTESAVSEAASDVKSASRLGRVGAGTVRLAKTLGTVGFHLLLPGPLDAIALMAQFAGSYAQAHEAIRHRNTRVGFRLGLAARLLGRSGAAVREHLARKVVLDRAVHTQVLNAVGLAEKSHNVGLSSGFDYGGKLTDEAKDALLQAGFSALAKSGRLPERKQLFTEEGVRLLASALGPAVDQIFAAMEAQADRERAKEQWRMNSAVEGNRWRI